MTPKRITYSDHAVVRRERLMRMTYSRDVDALMVELDASVPVAVTRSLSPTVTLELDAKGRLLGIEILEASASYPAGVLGALATPDEWLTLVEAGREAGLSPETLKKQLHAGRLVGEKRGRDWQVTRQALWNYLEQRDTRGRPPASAKGRRISSLRGRKPAPP